MSTFFLALIISISASVWLYARFFSRRTGGGNAKPAIIGSVVVGVILFIVVFFALATFLPK